MKKDKAALKSYSKEKSPKDDRRTKCWVSHMVDFHYGHESVYDKFPVPMEASRLSGFRFILPVTPDNPGSLSGWLLLEYDSDVQNDNFESSINDHGLYSHRILHKDLPLAAVTESHLIDELFSFDLEFEYINVQYLNVVYLVEGKEQGDVDIHPVVSFEFNCPKLCKTCKKVFNFHF
jgi:hypothetical protein